MMKFSWGPTDHHTDGHRYQLEFYDNYYPVSYEPWGGSRIS